MRTSRLQGFAIALAGGALLFGAGAMAQEGPLKPQFEKPVLIKAGEADAGASRYYPSPVMHDVDGDKVADMVIADLMGRVTWAKRVDGKFEKEQPLLDRDGKPLKFDNW